MKASHFLVRQESGKEVSALAGLRPSFRFQRNRAGRSHAARVLLRAQNSLRSFWGPARKPGTFRSAKKHKFQRQQLANLCFSKRVTPMAPEPSLRPKSRACARLASARACGRRTANEVAFSVARETARMTFVCSHPTDASKNDIWNRAGRDGVSGPHTGQHFAPRACGKAAAQK